MKRTCLSERPAGTGASLRPDQPQADNRGHTPEGPHWEATKNSSMSALDNISRTPFGPRTKTLGSDRFAGPVRDWLLVLLHGDARSRPRSPSSLYVYFGALRPFIDRWARERGHLREITAADVHTA